jgi:hypothetical protein
MVEAIELEFRSTVLWTFADSGGPYGSGLHAVAELRGFDRPRIGIDDDSATRHRATGFGTLLERNGRMNFGCSWKDTSRQSRHDE